jgi:hypothetical protein
MFYFLKNMEHSISSFMFMIKVYEQIYILVKKTKMLFSMYTPENEKANKNI